MNSVGHGGEIKVKDSVFEGSEIKPLRARVILPSRTLFCPSGHLQQTDVIEISTQKIEVIRLQH